MTFTPVARVSNSMEIALRTIEEEQSVAIHLRRGDYVHDPVINAYHGVCGPDYYRTAVREVQRRVPEVRWFLFTDEPDWVAEHLDLGVPFELVSGNVIADTAQELWLMSRCRHQVIANSSFSWWAAWLGEQKGKVVVAPRRWFVDPTVDTGDLIPEGWIRI